MTELCQQFEISRRTGYKWVGRFFEHGVAGLQDLSRAPKKHPNATSKRVVELLVRAKKQHPSWGPRKLLARLARQYPDEDLPAISTAGDILRRRGLVKSRRKRVRVPPYEYPFGDVQSPNDSWSADFKGWFRTGDGSRGDPLTVTDNDSRYLLMVRGLRETGGAHVAPWFDRLFREYGLPDVIRTDNGPPFASKGLGGLSKLSVWWIKLGIVPERIKPGKPQQNGRHERMHETLQAGTAAPPRDTLRAQQHAFNEFQHEFNFERPHEAIGDRPPAEMYESSARLYDGKTPALEYDDDLTVRSVRSKGEIKWRGNLLYVSEALAGESVALEQMTDRYWMLQLGPLDIGLLDDAEPTIRRLDDPRAIAVLVKLQERPVHSTLKEVH